MTYESVACVGIGCYLLSKIIARLGTWGSLCTCCILRYLMRLGLVGDH